MDLGTWGFWLSVVALVLMYPVGLLVNFTTPRVARSILHLSKRKLEEKASAIEGKLAEGNGWVMTQAEAAQYNFTARLYKFVFGGIHTVLVALLVVVYEFQKSSQHLSTESYYTLTGMLAGLIAGNYLTFWGNRREYMVTYWYHSPQYRSVMEGQASAIRKKLAS